jgi:preprotein translocase subunit SecD
MGGCGGSSTGSSSGASTPDDLTTHGGVRLVYRAISVDPSHPLGPAIDRAMEIIRKRLESFRPPAAFALKRVGDLIVVDLPGATESPNQIQLATRTAQLEFYDWEANALTPNGETVASQLSIQDPTATQISQGSAAAAPGNPRAGGMPLYPAVQLAAKQPEEKSSDNVRLGTEYFMFGAPGSAACKTAAGYYKTAYTAGQHCYLSGPDANLQDLYSSLPPGVNRTEGRVLAVKQGNVILQAVPSSFTTAVPWSAPTAQYFVLRDHAALLGSDIVNPQQSTDPAGSPYVSFALSSKGQKEFQNVTRAIARRGDLVSGLGQNLNQHFAVALDTQLITVPFIDFKTYPDGIPGDNGAEIGGSFTISSAQDLATQLRLALYRCSSSLSPTSMYLQHRASVARAPQLPNAR